MLRRWMSLVLLLSLALGGCSSGGDTPAGTQTAGANDLTISIAYSPEKDAWLKERIAKFNGSGAQVGGQRIFVEGINVSSGAARTQMLRNEIQPTVWSPSASTWLEVLKQESSNPNIATGSPRPLVLTPVVIGMWEPMAQALGWPNEEIGWRDLLDLINDDEGWGKYGHPEWGRFSWGHTDPEISTTALSTVLAELYAATNKTRGLTVDDVKSEQSQQFLRDLAQGIKHYGYNTLIFSDNMYKYGTTYISAFPMEEITLIEFNKRNPRTKLVAIYPEEGTFTHDDPFIVMSWATEDQRAAADQFYDFLLTDESQQLAMGFGFRPANPNVALADPISAQFGVDPQQPRTGLEVPPAEVIVAAKDSWANNRKPANVLLVVDTSGSMEGEKLDQVKAGLELFLSRIPPQDSVGLVIFSEDAEVLVPMAPRNENMIKLQDAIQGMIADGGTAVYSGLELGRQVLRDANQPDRINAIVLLSDGQDNRSSITVDELQRNFDESGISIFPVAYGDDADASSLERIAEFSRTQVVQGGSGDITAIFENLSRYF